MIILILARVFSEQFQPILAADPTGAALKRPFANDQLSVRGRFRMSQMIVGSALQTLIPRPRWPWALGC